MRHNTKLKVIDLVKILWKKVNRDRRNIREVIGKVIRIYYLHI